MFDCVRKDGDRVNRGRGVVSNLTCLRGFGAQPLFVHNCHVPGHVVGFLNQFDNELLFPFRPFLRGVVIQLAIWFVASSGPVARCRTAKSDLPGRIIRKVWEGKDPVASVNERADIAFVLSGYLLCWLLILLDRE